MNVITKSGNLSSYFRVTTQLVATSAKATAAIVPAHETKVPKSLDVVQSKLNNVLSAQTAITGGKSGSIIGRDAIKSHLHVIQSNIAIIFVIFVIVT